jgi:hypothetical protein
MLIRCPPVEKSGGDEDGFPVYGKMPDPFLMPSVVLDADEKSSIYLFIEFTEDNR